MSTCLWSDHPARAWHDGYPLGAGALAAMLLGPPSAERLALNHEWLWRARHRFRDHPPCSRELPAVRRLFFEGRLREAAERANAAFGGSGGVLGRPNRVDPYQPAGDLWITRPPAAVRHYRRCLDLDRAVIRTNYTVRGAAFTTEVLAHATRPFLAVHWTCSRRGALTFDLRLSRRRDPDCALAVRTDADILALAGRFAEGSRFAIGARLHARGGRSRPAARRGALQVRAADEALLILTLAVSHDGGDPSAEVRRRLGGAAPDWTRLQLSHVRAHRRWFRRVSLRLGRAPSDPTDRRPAGLRAGRDDPDLLALYFHLGRYLLISGSRPGGLPLNLQGKWNEALQPPWECDLHHDINLQMNYWPAEVCGLPELAEPLFDHIERFVPHARQMARALYGCRGVLFPLQTDPWGRATPESRGWDVWTGAAAWLAQHLWWRYEFGGDRVFLRERAYPFLREVAAFYESYLVRDRNGFRVPVPSQSPENHFIGGAQPVSLCVGATMDLELIRDVLSHALEASRILRADLGRRAAWRRILADLPPLRVGGHGQLQEWMDDRAEAEPGHRHLSHLFALFPGDGLDPALREAARVALLRRLAAGGQMGWSRAWAACCLARLGDGDLALEQLQRLIADNSSESLLDMYAPQIFQIDANLGAAAAVAEMLLQSHGGRLRILPALPHRWPDGTVKGLCARGGFIVDITWRNGRPRAARLRSKRGGPCRLAVGVWGAPRVQHGSRLLPVRRLPGNGMALDTQAGHTYALNWA